MNKDQMAGQWQQLKGKIKETYGDLTDDDIALYEGKKDQFFGKIKEKYGIEKAEAEQRMSALEKSCDSGSDKSHAA